MLNSKIGLKLTFGVVLTVLVVIGIFAYFNIQSENKEPAHGSRAACESAQRTPQVGHGIRHAAQLIGSESMMASAASAGRRALTASVYSISQERSSTRRTHPRSARWSTRMQRVVTAAIRQGQPLEHLETAGAHTDLPPPIEDSSRLLGIINPIYNEQSCWTAACHAHPESQTVLGVLDVTMPLRS